MSRQLKTMMSEALRDRYGEVSEACVVDLSGLNVADTLHVRRSLRAKGMRAEVVKNSMAKRAFAGGPLEAIGERLSGPCALVTGGDSIISMARELKRLAGEHERIKLKHGLLAGVRELIPIEELAKFKSFRELLGDVVMLLSSPGRALAGCLRSPQGKIAGCIKALADRGGEG